MKNLIPIVFIVFLLSGMAAAQDTLYSETFANGSLENTWYAGYSGNNMQAEFYPNNPSGDLFVGKLGNDLSGGGVGQSYSGHPSFSDLYYEAWVYIPVEATTAGTYYGIEFRIDSTENTSGYQFLARFNEGVSDPKLRFRSRPSGGLPSVIKDWSPAEIPGGVPDTSGWHHMAVEAIGNQFRFWYDDQELPGGPYTDNTFSSGWIGAYVWDFALAPIYLYIDDIYVISTSTGINDPQMQLLSGYELRQNFPNPFNPSTQIDFALANREFVQLDIFNNLGQKIKSLAHNEFSAGIHEVQWDGRDDSGKETPAGVYYYSINAGQFQQTKKMLLIK